MKIEAEAFHYPKFNLVVVMLGRMVTLQVKKVNVLKANIPRQRNEVKEEHKPQCGSR